jgi:hypothetical protein
MSVVDDAGRDLRVSAQVGAAIRLGLAEILQKLAATSPLSTDQALGHIQYELNVLKGKYEQFGKGSDGKGTE